MNLGFLAHSRYIQIDWIPLKSSWYPYDFDAGLFSCVKETVELDRRRQKDRAVLSICKLPEVPVKLVEVE